MIKNINEEKTTPRKLAKEILELMIDDASYWTERHKDQFNEMTDKEINQVNDQIKKVQNMLFKKLI